MADDGYALAGIAWQEVGQPQTAIQLWSKQVKQYPEGDLAAEGFWRQHGPLICEATRKPRLIGQLMIWSYRRSQSHALDGRSLLVRTLAPYPDVHDPLASTRMKSKSRSALHCSQISSIVIHLDSIHCLPHCTYEQPERLQGIERPNKTGHPTIWSVELNF